MPSIISVVGVANGLNASKPRVIKVKLRMSTMFGINNNKKIWEISQQILRNNYCAIYNI